MGAYNSLLQTRFFHPSRHAIFSILSLIIPSGVIFCRPTFGCVHYTTLKAELNGFVMHEDFQEESQV